MKILLAEDDVILSKVVEKKLTKNNHIVKIVCSGRKVIEVLKLGELFDLIITDIIMPDVDELKLLKYIRSSTRYKKTPVIITTAKNDKKTIMSAMELGISGYLVKPVSVETLVTKINEALINVPGAILIVDDEELIRSLLTKVLEREGLQVETANDGVDALKSLENKNISLIISDIKMPHMTGTELLVRVKEKYPEIPVMLMTGYGLDFTKQEAISSGADDYITKPFKNVEITHKIHLCLKRSKNHIVKMYS